MTGFFARIGFALLALGIGFSAPARADDKKVTILIWGTTWSAVVQQLAEQFTRETGIKVEAATQTTSGEGLTKLQAMRSAPVIDVWFTTSSVAERAVVDDKLFASLPADRMPNLKAVIPDARHEKWVAAYYYPLGIVWRPDMVSKPITSWQDLWRPDLENKLGLPAPSSYQARMLLIAALIGGGSIDNVEPGFEKLKELRKNVAFWYTSDAQARRALAQGEIAVLVAPTSGARAVRDQGVAVEMISPKPAPTMYDVMTLVKSGNEALGAQFIDFIVSSGAQQAIAEKMQMGPVVPGTKVPAIMAPELPKPGDEVTFDENVINAHIDAWTDRFNQTVAK